MTYFERMANINKARSGIGMVNGFVTMDDLKNLGYNVALPTSAPSAGNVWFSAPKGLIQVPSSVLQANGFNPSNLGYFPEYQTYFGSNATYDLFTSGGGVVGSNIVNANNQTLNVVPANVVSTVPNSYQATSVPVVSNNVKVATMQGPPTFELLGTMAVGSSWTVSITNAPPNSVVSADSTQNGVSLGSSNFGTTDNNGNFTLNGVYDETTAGTWLESWYVGGTKIATINFVIANTQSSVASSNSAQGASNTTNQSTTSVPQVVTSTTLPIVNTAISQPSSTSVISSTNVVPTNSTYTTVDTTNSSATPATGSSFPIGIVEIGVGLLIAYLLFKGR